MTLEEYKVQLKRHDWHYNMSDDGRAYREGSADRMRLIAQASFSGPEFKQAFAEEEARNFPKDKWPAYEPTFTDKDIIK